jgi:hypothetical protein
MNTKEAIKYSADTARTVTDTYLADLSDADLLVRSVPNANHIAWQLGHLICSEHEMVGSLGHKLPPLPQGFAEAHTKETCTSDESRRFRTKAEYLSLMKSVRAATMAALDATPDAELAKPAPESMRSYAPTVGSVFMMLGSHEMMHAGQFVPVRRKLGKPIVM